MSKPTKAQQSILERMADGAVITVDYDRRWVLKHGNDALRVVSKPMRRALRSASWTREDYGAMCYRLTDTGRAALDGAS